MKKTRKLTVWLGGFILALALCCTTGTMDVQAAAKINTKSATVYVGRTTILKVLNTKKTAKWKSSATSIATVSKKGVVKGKKAGKAVVTAQIGAKKYTCNVTVKNNVSVSKSSLTLNQGKSTKVTVSIKKSIKNMWFKIGNPDVVSCKWGKWKGKTIPLTITAKSGGSTTVTLTNTYSKEKVVIKVKVPQPWEKVKVVIPETIGEKNNTGNRFKILKYKFSSDYPGGNYYNMDITFQMVQYKNTRRNNWGEHFVCYDKEGRIISNCFLYASPLILNQKYFDDAMIPVETTKIEFMEYPENTGDTGNTGDNGNSGDAGNETPSTPDGRKEWTDADVRTLKTYVNNADTYAQKAFDYAAKGNAYGELSKTCMKTTVQKLQAAYDLAGRRKELTLYDSENNPMGTFQEKIGETIAQYDGLEEIDKNDIKSVFNMANKGNAAVIIYLLSFLRISYRGKCFVTDVKKI